MTDDRIESLIKEEIRKKKITFYDMNCLPNHAVDPNPEDKSMPGNKRARINKFTALMGCERMQELLCIGEYSPYDDLAPLKVSFQDLFRFWWNRCVEKELVVEEVLEDIFYYFTEKMRPPATEEKRMEITVDLEQMSFLTPEWEKAA